MTETIRDALEAKVRADAADHDARLARMKALAQQAYGTLTPEQLAIPLRQVMDSIYGHDGLPEEWSSIPRH